MSKAPKNVKAFTFCKTAVKPHINAFLISWLIKTESKALEKSELTD
jgi:hypothetical protein